MGVYLLLIFLGGGRSDVWWSWRCVCVHINLGEECRECRCWMVGGIYTENFEGGLRWSWRVRVV